MPSTLDLADRLAGVVAVQQEILSAVADLDHVLQVIVTRTPEVGGGTGAVVELVDGDELVYRAATGLAARHVGLYLPMTGSLSGMVVRERTMMHCQDTETDDRVDREACRAIGIRSMIIAPLLHEGDQALGVLKTFSDRPGAFNDLDAYVVQLLAGMTSAALLQAREFTERRASEWRYRLLFEQNVAGVFRTTREGHILDCNDALVQLLGYASREDLMSCKSWDFYPHREDREHFLNTLALTPTQVHLRLRLKRKDGAQFDGIMNVSVLPATGGDQILGSLVEG